MDDAGAKLEARAEPISHPVWVKDADELTLAPFTQNSGHPLLPRCCHGLLRSLWNAEQNVQIFRLRMNPSL